MTKTLKLWIAQLFYLTAVGGSIFCLFFFITTVWIGYEAKSLCQSAQNQYGGDCTSALIAQLDDEKQDFRSRNSAIWGLGQFGDRRALPILQKYYTGQIPEREPLNRTISQYELRKAINLANGGFNLTAWAWRWGKIGP